MENSHKVNFDILKKRKECGITRSALCKKLGISRYIMCQYEKNKALPTSVYEQLKELVPQWFM